MAHPHVVQPYEIISNFTDSTGKVGDRVIAYSLGSFTSCTGKFTDLTQGAVIFEINIVFQGSLLNVKVEKMEIFPVFGNKVETERLYEVVPADWEERFLERLDEANRKNASDFVRNAKKLLTTSTKVIA